MLAEHAPKKKQKVDSEIMTLLQTMLGKLRFSSNLNQHGYSRGNYGFRARSCQWLRRSYQGSEFRVDISRQRLADADMVSSISRAGTPTDKALIKLFYKT